MPDKNLKSIYNINNYHCIVYFSVCPRFAKLYVVKTYY